MWVCFELSAFCFIISHQQAYKIPLQRALLITGSVCAATCVGVGTTCFVFVKTLHAPHVNHTLYVFSQSNMISHTVGDCTYCIYGILHRHRMHLINNVFNAQALPTILIKRLAISSPKPLLFFRSIMPVPLSGRYFVFTALLLHETQT